jgi:hypothetical protein
MGQVALRAGVTEQEYLAFERAAEERHESIGCELSVDRVYLKVFAPPTA